jgi:hypothetical protein
LREAFRRIHDGLEDTSDMRVAWYGSDDGDSDVVDDDGVHDDSDYVVVDIVDNDDDDNVVVDIVDDYVAVMVVMMIHGHINTILLFVGKKSDCFSHLTSTLRALWAI